MNTSRMIFAPFKTFLFSILIVIMVLSLFPVESVGAAQGDQLGTLDTPVHCSSGIGVSVAFDGTFLYYGCWHDSNLYKVRLPLGSVMRANPTTPMQGTLEASIPTSLSSGVGAMAWDPGRRKLWIGVMSGDGGIYLVDPKTGAATRKFSFPGTTYNFPDGLAYDGSDDTLWFSDDVSSTIYHVTTNGALINSFPVSFPNSGLAVGGPVLFAGSDGQGKIYRLDKTTGQVLDVFASPGGRDEDLECDGVTFTGVNAMWSKDAYNDLVYAFEIPSGVCNTGGSNLNLADVPDYKQYANPWGPDPYDWHIVNGQKVSRHDSWTVTSSGCYITSVVNIMRYLKVTRAVNGLDVTPRTLNDYLSNEYTNKDDKVIPGYNQWGGAIWAAVAKYTGDKVAISGLSVSGDQAKIQAIDSQLANNQPVMVGVPYKGVRLYKDLNISYQNDLNQGSLTQAFRDEFSKKTLTNEMLTLSPNDKLLIWKIATNRWWIHDTEYSDTNHKKGDIGYIAVVENNTISIYRGNKDGHYVVIVGPRTNGHYLIHDPGGFGGTDLSSYGDLDGIGAVQLVQPANGYKPQQRIAAHSPVELLVYDPWGRRAGYDPDTQTYYDEIPDAQYVVENPIVDQASGEPLGEPEKVLYLPQPEAGSYFLSVIGIGDGPYAVDFQALDANGKFITKFVGGNASAGSVVNYSYDYDGGEIFLEHTFADVPDTHWAFSFIERLYAAGITGGCTFNPLSYCPGATVTRAQMAIFLLRGIHGSSYAPPDVGGDSGFGDVSPTSPSAPWIKQLAAEGITGGCGNGNFCPNAPVSRTAMAIFLLRSEHGSSYSPPDAGGNTGFNDVPPEYPNANWIKQLVQEGITAGCGSGNYCPTNPVTRDQMAVFLVRTFALP